MLLGVTKAVKSGQYRVKKSVKSSRERIVVLYRVLRESKHRILLFELRLVTWNVNLDSGRRVGSTECRWYVEIVMIGVENLEVTV